MSDPIDSFEGLFPLPLTSIEQFHLLDHQPEFPNNLLVALRFEGHFEFELFNQSLKHAARMHPLLGCVVQDRSGRSFWVRGPDVDLLVDATDSENWFQPIDLSIHPGIRCYLTSNETGKDDVTRPIVWFQFHHAACDGAGVIQFLTKAFHAYDNLVAKRDIDAGFRVPNHQQLARRGILGLTKWRYLKHLWKLPVGLFGATKFIFRKHRGLVDKPDSTDISASCPNPPTMIGHWISRDTLRQLRALASQGKVTLNTLMLTELFRATHDWNMKQSRGSQSEWIRMVVPMNIRSVSDRWLPATNRSTVVQIDRRPAQFENYQGLLAGIDTEINVIRNWHLDKIFLIAIRCMSIFPKWLRAAARNQKCRGAAVWTNMGEPSRRAKFLSKDGLTQTGNLRLVEMDVAGPVRQLTPVNICVMQYHNKMRLTMRIDTRQLSLGDAQQLMDCYVERLNSIVQETIVS